MDMPRLAVCHPVAIAQVVEQVRGPQFNPGWLLVFHRSRKIFLSLFIVYTVYMYTTV